MSIGPPLLSLTKVLKFWGTPKSGVRIKSTTQVISLGQYQTNNIDVDKSHLVISVISIRIQLVDTQHGRLLPN